ncbi:MAG: hypothetical protein CMG39_04295 [Candidatus Marinimicrobia bacterium]|nr:hypothetical protein [Candidatus Neomarinimicrobiota bacterium]|tara:strand:- start:587 stop:1267 length:681 start_codon:yes stop_codon:yes gene_type:complete
MVIGNGLIAKAFDLYKSNKSILIFASGVSNSLEHRLSEFKKEENILLEVMDTYRFEKFVYFSSCYLNDLKEKGKYLFHKKRMEELVKKQKNFLIFRLPIVVGNIRNNKGLINHILYKIKKKQELYIYKKLKRNLIGVDDVYYFTNKILLDNKINNKIINLSSKHSWLVQDIVNEIELILNKKAILKFIDDKIENIEIDLKDIDSLTFKNDLFCEDYHKKVLRKYLK